VKRREFITMLGGAAAWPLAARAEQSKRVRRLGVLMGIPNDAEGQSRIETFRRALNGLGWTEGDDIVIKYYWAAANQEEASRFAEELLAWQSDALLSNSTPMTLAISKATQTVPIVFVNVGDPIASGFVQNFARPGSNVTGFANFEPSLAGKWLELLKELNSRITRVTYLFNPETIAPRLVPTVKDAAPLLSIEAVAAPVSNVSGIEKAIAELAAARNSSALLVLPDIFLTANRRLIIELVARQGLPAMYPFKFFTRDGGLISYGIESFDAFRQAASYIDRILRGAKASDLPVQAPTRFELVINLKTVKSLGLTFPPNLLARADEVIE
jgi:putative ABC transport system substrate-binding protein